MPHQTPSIIDIYRHLKHTPVRTRHLLGGVEAPAFGPTGLEGQPLSDSLSLLPNFWKLPTARISYREAPLSFSTLGWTSLWAHPRWSSIVSDGQYTVDKAILRLRFARVARD